MSRFDYVRYDGAAQELQVALKDVFEKLEAAIEKLGPSRSVSLAMTSLEETYMWVGKAIRDNQIARTGKAELQEERKNG